MFDWNWPAGSREDLFFNINTCNYGFPIMAPPDSWGPIWIYIMSDSFHVNTTFSSSVVHERKTFKWPHPIFVIISPLKRNWSFIWTIQNPIHPRMICTKRDWKWPTGSGGEDFFSNINTCKFGFSLLWPLQTPVNHNLNNCESTLYQKAFM
jgi:hypothetical protein